jgi:hypothetical protein
MMQRENFNAKAQRSKERKEQRKDSTQRRGEAEAQREHFNAKVQRRKGGEEKKR